MAGDVLAELILESFDVNDGIIVPLPTISKHIRERGFAHIEFLATKLSSFSRQRQSLRSYLACAKILKRANSTVQVGASAEKRKIQAEEAYSVAKGFDPSKHYILVDDVWTTGSSMLAAAQKLRSLGAQNVDILVIAKTV